MSYDPNTLRTACALIEKRLGPTAEVAVSRRSDRWIASVKWVSEIDGSVQMHGVFGKHLDPNPDSALWNLVDWVARLTAARLV